MGVEMLSAAKHDNPGLLSSQRRGISPGMMESWIMVILAFKAAKTHN
jgi:hypothetical protein